MQPAHGNIYPCRLCFLKRAVSDDMSFFGLDMAQALGTALAPQFEAMVQQQVAAQMASFVQELQPLPQAIWQAGLQEQASIPQEAADDVTSRQTM